MEWYHYLIILAVLVLISLIVIKINRKDFSSDINKLLKYLGGKDNIINAECNLSRFKVIIKDMSKVDKDGIQKLGAKGIVEIEGCTDRLSDTDDIVQQLGTVIAASDRNAL